MLLLTAAACTTDADDGPQGPLPDSRYDFVTYEGYGQGEARFQYVGRDDSTAISLTAAMSEAPKDLADGQRVLLNYQVLQRTTATAWQVQVNYINSGNVASDSLRVGTLPLPQWPMRVRSLWRSGAYLNLRAEVEWTGKPRRLMLVADSTTVQADTVHCYLVHDLMQADTTYFWRTCYGSFFVGNLMKKPTCHVMRVHVADVVRPETITYDFCIKY